MRRLCVSLHLLRNSNILNVFLNTQDRIKSKNLFRSLCQCHLDVLRDPSSMIKNPIIPPPGPWRDKEHQPTAKHCLFYELTPEPDWAMELLVWTKLPKAHLLRLWWVCSKNSSVMGPGGQQQNWPQAKGVQ
jgi:hypothetical protein